MRVTSLVVAIAAGAALASGAAAQDTKQLSRAEAAAELEIRGLKAEPDGSVSGVIHNNTQAVMKDIKLLVKHTWYWKNERHPGEDSPGRSEYIAVQGEIPPGGDLPFSHAANPPLASRSDGTFKTTVGVQEFTQVGE